MTDYIDSGTVSTSTSVAYNEMLNNIESPVVTVQTYISSLEELVIPSGSWGPFDNDDGTM